MTPVRIILVALALLQILGLPAPAQDHLVPERGSLNETKLRWVYMKKLRKVLLNDTAVHHQARMICCPSFDPEWAITLTREGETELFPGNQRDYAVEYVGAEKNLFYAKQYRKVAVKRAGASLDRETAEAVSQVWQQMLDATQKPETNRSGVDDGVSFHFSRDVPGSMYRGWLGPAAGAGEGQVHAPRENSITGEFAALGGALKKHALAQPEERDQIRSDIRTRVAQLKAKLDRQRLPE